MGTRRFLVVALIAGGACSQYTFQPETNATATVRGRVAADYPLPSSSINHGDVRIASFGVSKIKRADETSYYALHVRMVVSNNGGQPWTLTTAQQRVQLHKGPTLAPAFARSDANDLAEVVVQPGSKRTLDLFYPLPRPEEHASRIPEFDFLWRISADGHTVAERTPFERLAIMSPEYAYSGFGLRAGWGPYGWYDPNWGPEYIGPAQWYW